MGEFDGLPYADEVRKKLEPDMSLIRKHVIRQIIIKQDELYSGVFVGKPNMVSYSHWSLAIPEIIKELQDKGYKAKLTSGGQYNDEPIISVIIERKG